jgi:hypothetical protein
MEVIFLKSFTNLLDEFIEDLEMLMPNNPEIGAYKMAIDSLKKYNPRGLLDQFMSYVGPYYAYIFQKNEAFFLNLDNLKADSNFQQYDESEQQESFMKMVELKDKWSDLTEHNKNAIWDYFQALLRNGAQASRIPEHRQILTWINANYSN